MGSFGTIVYSNYFIVYWYNCNTNTLPNRLNIHSTIFLSHYKRYVLTKCEHFLTKLRFLWQRKFFYKKINWPQILYFIFWMVHSLKIWLDDVHLKHLNILKCTIHSYVFDTNNSNLMFILSKGRKYNCYIPLFHASFTGIA